MELSPDAIVFWQWGGVALNATLIFTWIAMAVLTTWSWLVTRGLSTGARASPHQTLMETLVTLTVQQIEEITLGKAERLLPFSGTLFLFIAAMNLLGVIPFYRSPTGSLSTTAALAVCVFFAVPLFGILERGFVGYFKQYIQPSVFMLPFNIIGELTRTLALAVRLFGNVMSGEMIVAILLAVVPLFFPVVMQLLGMLVGVIQAYIFAVLATVFIASATGQENRK